MLFLFPSSVRAMEKCNIISSNGLDLGGEIDCVEETIVLKVVPKPDYKLSKLIITTISGKKIEIGSNEFIMNNDGTLSIDPKVFVMPLENISIEFEWGFINPKTGNSVVFVIVFIILFISMVGGIIIKCPQLK